MKRKIKILPLLVFGLLCSTLAIAQHTIPATGGNASGSGLQDGAVIGTTPTGSPLWICNYENGNIHFGTNNARRMDIGADGRITMNGLLSINQGVSEGGALFVNDSEALWWNGTYFSWGYGATWNYFADRVSIGRAVDPTSSYMLYVQGNAYSTGSWNTSDARLKKNISEIDNPLGKLMKTRGTIFEFRTDEYEDYNFAEGTQFGFIAQELEHIFPELVNTDNKGYKSVNYNGMTPILVEAIKEQQRQIESQQKEIDELKALVNNLIANQ
ncbi:MAG: tail fiber domain-containing protein [Bacteroidales bacterium]|nr:tail fiber domain-containing protein [Bacteroidales bacterium]